MGVITKDLKVKIPIQYRSIDKYHGQYFVLIQKDSVLEHTSMGDPRSIKSLYGLIDGRGHIVIPCECGSLRTVNDSLLVVTTAMKTNCALFKIKGEQLTGFEYMEFGPFVDGLAKARIDQQYGFINTKGKLIIPVIYDYCEDFKNGYAIFSKKNKWGLLNVVGDIAIRPEYDYKQIKEKVKEMLLNPNH